jgi:4-hydroxy-4-methyl-2-oxoglutarate aldolase
MNGSGEDIEIKTEGESESMAQDELLGRFSKLYTGAISDALDQLGCRSQVLPKELQGLAPDTKLCGFALTVRGEATDVLDQDEIFIPLLRMLGDVQQHQVVISQPGDDICAHLGELSATTIQARGGVGAVIYGGVRDVDYIRKLGFPVFHLYTTPVDIVGRWCLKEYNIPIRIKNVTIEPQDVIVGDQDGVLVVPGKRAMEVLLLAEQLVATENHVRDDVRQGIHPLDSYAKHRWF